METYWRAVLESLHDEIIIVGRDMRLKWANKAVRERWDEGRNGPVAGLPCHVVNHGGKPCAASECPCPVREVLSSGRAATALHVHPAGDGTKRYVEIVASPLQCGNGPVGEVVEVMHDVTAQQRAQQSLRRRNEELSAMYRVTLAVGSSLDLDEVLQMALQTVVEVTHMDAGAIYLRQENDALMLRAYLNLSAETTRTARILRLNESACGQVSARGWPLITHGDEEADRPLWEPLRRSGLRTLIHIPLKANRRAVGTLCLGHRQEHRFDEETLRLLNTLGRQIGVAIERARLHQELERKERMLQALLQQVITAQEDERRRIARELHDEVMQALTTLLYHLETFSQMGASPQQEPLARKMWSLVQDTLDEIHNLIYDLRPSMLDNLGLLPAVRWWIDQRLKPQGIQAHLAFSGTTDGQETLPPLSPEQETAIFRVLQEAIANIADHAQARHVTIAFEHEEDHLIITVEDDGIGFDLEEAMQFGDSKRGLGLLGMWERMELIGGSLIISSSPGEGTAISLRCPLHPEVAYGEKDPRFAG